VECGGERLPEKRNVETHRDGFIQEYHNQERQYGAEDTPDYDGHQWMIIGKSEAYPVILE